MPETTAEDRPSDATLRLLERLVAVDTTSTTASNIPVIDICEELLADLGAWTERVDSPGHEWDGGDIPKQGLLARIGPDVDGGLVLSGHTDCVPTTEQPWTTDPLSLTERDGVLVGRGTTDMKGFIATALTTAFPAAADADLARPLWLLLTYDEEIGCIGSSVLTDALVARTRPGACVVGEPTGLVPAIAHKGVRSFTVTVHGSEGHSSRTDLFANALVGAARIAVHADEVAARLREEAAGPMFAPPYTTVGITQLHSGTAINIIPREARLVFEHRAIPRDDSWALSEEIRERAESDVLPRLREIDPDARIEWQRGPVSRGLVPEDATAVDGDGPAVSVDRPGLAERMVRAALDHDGDSRTVPFGTDGGWHQAGGISTVVCGPGEIEQAHQPDEWIDPAQLAGCERMLTALVAQLTE